MRLPIQPRREAMWTFEWPTWSTPTRNLTTYGQRQAYQIVLEERFERHGEFSVSGKSYKVYAVSEPLGCPNTPRYFPAIGPARAHAAMLVTLYGGFSTRQEWDPGQTKNSRWTDPLWEEKWHRTRSRSTPGACLGSVARL